MSDEQPWWSVQYGPERACCEHCYGCCVREDHLTPCFTCDPDGYARFYDLTSAGIAARLAVNAGYQAALQDAEAESWDGPGIEGKALIDALTERRRKWRASLRGDAGKVAGDYSQA